MLFRSDVKKLTDAGLPVYFVDGKPEGVFHGEMSEQVLKQVLADAEVIGLADIAEKTKEVADITIAPKDSHIRYYHYIKEDGMQIYMLVNEGREVYEGSLDLVQEKEKTISVYVYDAWKQIRNRYNRDIPKLMRFCALSLISDGANTKLGNIYTPYEYYYSK